MIFEKTLSTIKKYNLIEKGDKIVLGLSGGPDSVCLLHLLNRMKDVLDIEVYAAHLNHQIRGMEAQKDALYVSDLCERLGITFFVKSIDVPKYCKENNIGLIVISHDKSLLDKVCHRIVNLEENHKEEIIENII